MHCGGQNFIDLAKQEMPFRMKDGNHYFEAIE